MLEDEMDTQVGVFILSGQRRKWRRRRDGADGREVERCRPARLFDLDVRYLPAFFDPEIDDGLEAAGDSRVDKRREPVRRNPVSDDVEVIGVGKIGQAAGAVARASRPLPAADAQASAHAGSTLGSSGCPAQTSLVLGG